jgi:hypothetical protein
MIGNMSRRSRQYKEGLVSITHEYFTRILKARAEGDNEGAEALDRELRTKTRRLHMENQAREDSDLRMRAHELDIEGPPYGDDMWDTDESSLMILSLKGRQALRKAIDEEKTRRREVAAWWWKT